MNNSHVPDEYIYMMNIYNIHCMPDDLVLCAQETVVTWPMLYIHCRYVVYFKGYSVIETAFPFLIIFIFQSIQFDLDDDSVTQARSGNTIGNKRLYREVN